MPRFFFPLPGLSPEDEERVYCQWAVNYDVPVVPPHKRIFRLTFMNPHRLLVAEVGEQLAPTWSTVVAIFPGPPIIVACSQRHEHSAVVPADCVKEIEYFHVDA